MESKKENSIPDQSQKIDLEKSNEINKSRARPFSSKSGSFMRRDRRHSKARKENVTA
jgi:hypothetical protein